METELGNKIDKAADLFCEKNNITDRDTIALVRHAMFVSSTLTLVDRIEKLKEMETNITA